MRLFNYIRRFTQPEALFQSEERLRAHRGDIHSLAINDAGTVLASGGKHRVHLEALSSVDSRLQEVMASSFGT